MKESADAFPFNAPHYFVDDSSRIGVFITLFDWRASTRLRTLSQPSTHAKAKAAASSRAPLGAACDPTAAAIVVNVHGIVATEAHTPLRSRLLLARCNDRLKRTLLLAPYLLSVHGLLLDLCDLCLEICEGRVAAF